MLYRSFTTAAAGAVRGNIKVEVVFGSPRNACRYVGICEMQMVEWRAPQPQAVSCCGQRGRALVSRLGREQLLIHFIRSSLSPATRSRQFAQHRLQLLHAFELPAPIVRRLGLPGAVRLPAGSYPVADLGVHWSVALPLLTDL